MFQLTFWFRWKRCKCVHMLLLNVHLQFKSVNIDRALFFLVVNLSTEMSKNVGDTDPLKRNFLPNTETTNVNYLVKTVLE